MIEIEKGITNEVKKIVDYLEKYDNRDNLSWMKVYHIAAKDLNIKKEKVNNILLLNTVKEISNRGYDIIDEPFKLEKYR